MVGTALGAIAGWVQQLAGRVRTLETQAKRSAPAARATPVQAQRERPTPSRAAEKPRQEHPVTESGGAVPPPALDVGPPPPLVDAAARLREPRTPPLGSDRADLAERAREARRAQLEELDARPFEAAVHRVLAWFTTGNVPVKVGVVLSVIGAAFFVKEGIDRNWFTLPIELRLLSIALFGIALLLIGWHRRDTHRTFALGVQGGGIAVLYLTTYAAYANFHVVGAPFAFILLVVVTVAAGALAVLQNTRTLAVLGIVGGFMAPILTSTDAGNHVALFSYYAVLNLAILGIAWFKAWRELNMLGFLFTFGIGSLWGYQGYRPEHFATTEPFLAFFFALYTLIPVLFASRVTTHPRGFVDGSLVFGTPIAAFGLQSQLVGDTEYGLAITALVFALVYAGIATHLHRRRSSELGVLLECELALGIAFLTIAVPLAVNAGWTSAAWTLQGAAMVWLGFRQRRKLAQVAGLALQLLAGVAYTAQTPEVAPLPLLNGHWLGAALLAFVGWFSALMFDPERGGRGEDEAPQASLRYPGVANALFVWASAWWLLGGFAEIDQFVSRNLELAAVLVFTAATTALAMFGARALTWPRLNALGLASWLIAVLGAAYAVFSVGHPAAGLGWIAWPVLLAAMYALLRVCEQQFAVLRAPLHAIAYWIAALLLAWEIHWQVDQIAVGVWAIAATLAFGATCVLATLRARTRVLWPFAAFADLYLRVCTGAVLALTLLGVVLANIASPGTALPLPYVPVLNPLELVSGFVVFVLLHWLAAAEELIGISARHRAIVAASCAWFLVTMAVARAVHHFVHVPWELDQLAASTVLQAALSIVWGAGGLGTMLIGARAGRRVVWVTGAAIMGVVVVKLFLVDLGNTDTLARVVSFLGVGLLLLVVGYFAPVPPRTELEENAA
jgi:uncharacterized membrane protein